MPRSVVLATFVAVLAAAQVATGQAPAWSQDFSITNPVEPPLTGRRDLIRQLQAWWDKHAFYPRRASQANEGGTVRVRLAIRADGNVWKVDVVGGSGSPSLDAAALGAFRNGFVRPFPAGEPETEIELSLRYVLIGTAPAAQTAAQRPFTVTNEPVRSPILETMLQRRCTGTVVKEGIRNNPMYGGRHSVQAIFFQKPDGTPWVQFDEGGEPLTAPVTEAGKMVQWTGRLERPRRGVQFYYQYTVWADGENTLSGNIEAFFWEFPPLGINTGGTVDLACATETVPAVTWRALAVHPYQAPPIDPP